MSKVSNALQRMLCGVVLGLWGWGAQAADATEKGNAAPPPAGVAVEARNDRFAAIHPDQYASWLATSEQGERADALAEDPRLVILWAGYAFAKDYNKPRGHAYALTDVRETLRTGAPMKPEDGPQPMACWSCKSPDVARVIVEQGEDAYYHGTWASGGPQIVNALGCADCHNTASADFAAGKPALHLSRPYAVRALEAIGKPFEQGNRFRSAVDGLRPVPRGVLLLRQGEARQAALG